MGWSHLLPPPPFFSPVILTCNNSDPLYSSPRDRFFLNKQIKSVPGNSMSNILFSVQFHLQQNPFLPSCTSMSEGFSDACSHCRALALSAVICTLLSMCNTKHEGMLFLHVDIVPTSREVQSQPRKNVFKGIFLLCLSDFSFSIR